MVIVDDNRSFDAQRPLRVVAFACIGDDVGDDVAGPRCVDVRSAEGLTPVPCFVVVDDTFLTVSAP